MKIGIKYCGGCNPTYDRTDVASRLKKHSGFNHNIELAKQGTIYDVIVIICGCICACADHQNLEAKYEKVCIISESDIIKLLNNIDKIKVL
ncbi:hypothetical protein K9O30_17240 [Clostridium bowmanii]|uniref:hypothetical protein n=1 Tax=Clostridium bowmanii TaxID=132925 RepID=UPI001C0BA1C3|nr:hypothetical protein [Clostridium bowmanii]MBU3190948.1 hypothetical protein [Clostridium bowmanii]MCA1075433.1 hypothetical protein [Clostridium bowmanii]